MSRSQLGRDLTTTTTAVRATRSASGSRAPATSTRRTKTRCEVRSPQRHRELRDSFLHDEAAELLADLGDGDDSPGKDDGAALLARLTALAVLDATSLAEAIAASDVLAALVAANSLARFAHAELAEAITSPALEGALRGLNESIGRSVAQALTPALESFAASIEVPPLPGLEAVLVELAEQVSLNHPTQDLLASFGQEWATELASAGAASGDAVPSAIDVVEAAHSVALVSTRG